MAEPAEVEMPTAADEDSASAEVVEDSLLNDADEAVEEAVDQPEIAPPGNAVRSPSADKSKEPKPKGGMSINGTKFVDRSADTRRTVRRYSPHKSADETGSVLISCRQSAQDYMQLWIAGASLHYFARCRLYLGIRSRAHLDRAAHACLPSCNRAQGRGGARGRKGLLSLRPPLQAP